jgi:hypothetical protein
MVLNAEHAVAPYAASFLGLPSDIRKQILRAAGLVRKNCPIGPSVERPTFASTLFLPHFDGDPDVQTQDDYLTSFNFSKPTCFDERPALPVQLLQIHPTVYDEARSILYGENTLLINIGDPRDLMYLTSLCSKSLAWIRRIHIILAPESHSIDVVCEGQSELWNICGYLSDKLPAYQVAVNYCIRLQWNPHHIRKLLEPLSALPPLLSLRVQAREPNNPSEFVDYLDDERAFRWLCRRFERKQFSGALWGEEVQTKLTQQPQTKGWEHFPFSLLPSELQTLVLSHSDVVSPSKCGVQFIHCGCCGYCNDGAQGFSCWCSRGGNYSSTCVCYPSESGLWAVSRSVRNECERVYYTHNIFELSNPAVDGLAADVSVIPAVTLRSIHKLRLGISPLTSFNGRLVQEWTYRDDQPWFKIVEKLHAHCRLDIINITVILRYVFLDANPLFVSQDRPEIRTITNAFSRFGLEHRCSVYALLSLPQGDPIKIKLHPFDVTSTKDHSTIVKAFFGLVEVLDSSCHSV